MVLDANTPGQSPDSAIWSAQADTNGLSQVTHFDIATDADFAVTPDGRELVTVGHTDLASTHPTDTVSVLDPRTGKTLASAQAQRWQGTNGFHPVDKIVISRDGRFAYFLVGFPGEPPAPPQALATYDISLRLRSSQHGSFR
jgi:DNA-binding beta-propeller fold protein YncE